MIWIAGGLLKATMFSLVTNLEGHVGTPMPNSDQKIDIDHEALRNYYKSWVKSMKKLKVPFFRSLPFRMLSTVKNSLNNGFFSTPKYLFDEYQIPRANYVSRICPQNGSGENTVWSSLVYQFNQFQALQNRRDRRGLEPLEGHSLVEVFDTVDGLELPSNHLACKNPSINSILCLFNLTCYVPPWRIVIKPPSGEYFLFFANDLKQYKEISVRDS